MSFGTRILVTGASGFIGRRIVSQLESANRDHLAWTRDVGDLQNKSDVLARLNVYKPNVILHLAARSSADEKQGMASAVSKEVKMIKNLVESMPLDCRLILTGSMAEYGYSGYFGENDHCRPKTVYGAAKLGCTNYALAVRESHSLDISVARLFGVYGVGEKSSRLFPYLVSQLLAGRRVSLSDGSQLRDFVAVNDVCSSLINMADVAEVPFPLVNVGTGVGITVRDACIMVAKVLNADLSLLGFDEIPRRAVDENCLVAKTDRLAQLGPVPLQHWCSLDTIAPFVNDLRSVYEQKFKDLNPHNF